MKPNTQPQPSRRPKGPQARGGVIKPVSWRIWSSTWVTASSCMTWPPRTNSRRPWSTSWWTLALWAERKRQVTAPELCLVVFVGDMPVASRGPSFKLLTFIYSAKAGPCRSWSSSHPPLRPSAWEAGGQSQDLESVKQSSPGQPWAGLISQCSLLQSGRKTAKNDAQETSGAW